MTPEDILNKQFSSSMRGYKPDEVKAYLAQVSAELERTRRECGELQGKLEVLAEKLEDYRSDEESLRAALVGAQKLGEGVIREAKKKAEVILAEATQKADSLLFDAKRSMDAESYALNKMRIEVTKFRTQILNMYKKQVELVNALPYEEDLIAAEAAMVKPAAAAPPSPEPPPEPVATPGPPEEVIRLEYDLVSDEGQESTQSRKSRQVPLLFGDSFKLERNE